MSQVPVKWLEEFASTAHSPSADHDDIRQYIAANRVRLDKILDAQEAYI